LGFSCTHPTVNKQDWARRIDAVVNPAGVTIVPPAGLLIPAQGAKYLLSLHAYTPPAAQSHSLVVILSPLGERDVGNFTSGLGYIPISSIPPRFIQI